MAGIAARHGGRACYAASEEPGARFVIELPVIELPKEE
ncbi:hypothetical protein [Amycolatopsis vancoresmycina]